MLIHGLAEHLGCYDELGCRFAAENFLAFGHDHGEIHQNAATVKFVVHSDTASDCFRNLARAPLSHHL